MNLLLAATLLLASVANINADAADMMVPGLRGVDTADAAAADGTGASHSRRQLQNLLGDWAFCTSSSQCQNQCCSSKHSTSDGRLKCTPVGGFKTSEGCVGSATRHLRRSNEDEVLPVADETTPASVNDAAPEEELGSDIDITYAEGDELN